MDFYMTYEDGEKMKNTFEPQRRKIKRGDIYYADLSPVVGSEQGGLRPTVIISNDIGNKHSTTVIVAAVTGNTKKMLLPTHAVVSALDTESIVLLEQIRTIDRIRLRNYIGRLDDVQISIVDRALAISIGLD
jgi:mRNA interferase MazF